MSNVAEIILAISVACAVIAIGFATADHIRNARIVELETSNFALRSNAEIF